MGTDQGLGTDQGPSIDPSPICIPTRQQNAVTPFISTIHIRFKHSDKNRMVVL